HSRFRPGRAGAGEFRFDIGTAGAARLVLQTVVPILATAGERSRVEVCGGTHVPRSPSFHFLSRHWCEAVGRLGLVAPVELVRGGFMPRGGGGIGAPARPGARPA